jgi:hypothetical protein
MYNLTHFIDEFSHFIDDLFFYNRIKFYFWTVN